MIPNELRELFKREDFMLVQVGANDGRLDDPLHEIVATNRWRGILIEPLPWAFARLKETYAARQGLHFVRAAISDRRGTCVLWCLPRQMAETAEWDLSVLATTRRHLFTHELCCDRNEALRFEKFLRPVEVPCMTLNDIAQQYAVSHIDLLQIDVQGHECEVLNSLDFSRIRPKFVNYEHVLLEDRDRLCRRLLEGHGYRLTPGIDERYDTLATLTS